jgi:hypothetical protein
LVQFHSLCHSIYEAAHAPSFCWIFERYLMPTGTATSEQRLTIENAIALKPGDLNPSSFTTQMRDLLPFLPAILIALAA